MDNYAETILKIKKRFNDAIKIGLSNPESLLEILTSSLAEIEKHRMQALTQAQELEKQYRKLNGQAEAFNSMGGIVFHVLDSLIKIQERNEEQIDENKDQEEANAFLESQKKRTRKPKK